MNRTSAAEHDRVISADLLGIDTPAVVSLPSVDLLGICPTQDEAPALSSSAAVLSLLPGRPANEVPTGRCVNLSAPSRCSAAASGSNADLAGTPCGSIVRAFSATSSSATACPSSIEGVPARGVFACVTDPRALFSFIVQQPVADVALMFWQQLLNWPRCAAHSYAELARRCWLRPWSEFACLNLGRCCKRLRASRRGDIQIYIQRNMLANARTFCPNYMFLFAAILFMFVCTSPLLLCLLSGVSGGWSYTLRSENFKRRPWVLQMGGFQLPLGANVKMAMLSLPTFLMLHLFLGPVLWSAALCGGGVSMAHAALHDREDGDDGGSSAACGV